MVEIRRLKSKVSKVYELVDGPEDHPLFGIGNRELEQNDNNPDDLSEDIGRPPVLPDLNGDDIEAAGGDLPVDVRLIALLLSQGDNRHVEELLRTVHQNVIVNVNLSYYFKVMIFLLTFNTLLLFKWMLWDTLPSILD
ncbi:unnamed protein product [Acanthoscelides obtectus]|uniref:Uncharacterized protein n=1 Tax=Acanthoscelides obtectus TaxID=200917 RepID=A0A9P0KX29_ACAOB|nr:unnamed protein product [Acanthoscelides obtectus]CAK1646052.1 hypothetical protein AOBTE_LOCUS14416 [Acanthoscelides obtectus]